MSINNSQATTSGDTNTTSSVHLTPQQLKNLEAGLELNRSKVDTILNSPGESDFIAKSLVHSNPEFVAAAISAIGGKENIDHFFEQYYAKNKKPNNNELREVIKELEEVSSSLGDAQGEENYNRVTESTATDTYNLLTLTKKVDSQELTARLDQLELEIGEEGEKNTDTANETLDYPLNTDTIIKIKNNAVQVFLYCKKHQHNLEERTKFEKKNNISFNRAFQIAKLEIKIRNSKKELKDPSEILYETQEKAVSGSDIPRVNNTNHVSASARVGQASSTIQSGKAALGKSKSRQRPRLDPDLDAELNADIDPQVLQHQVAEDGIDSKENENSLQSGYPELEEKRVEITAEIKKDGIHTLLNGWLEYYGVESMNKKLSSQLSRNKILFVTGYEGKESEFIHEYLNARKDFSSTPKLHTTPNESVETSEITGVDYNAELVSESNDKESDSLYNIETEELGNARKYTLVRNGKKAIVRELDKNALVRAKISDSEVETYLKALYRKENIGKLWDKEDQTFDGNHISYKEGAHDIQEGKKTVYLMKVTIGHQSMPAKLGVTKNRRISKTISAIYKGIVKDFETKMKLFTFSESKKPTKIKKTGRLQRMSRYIRRKKQDVTNSMAPFKY